MILIDCSSASRERFGGTRPDKWRFSVASAVTSTAPVPRSARSNRVSKTRMFGGVATSAQRAPARGVERQSKASSTALSRPVLQQQRPCRSRPRCIDGAGKANGKPGFFQRFRTAVIRPATSASSPAARPVTIRCSASSISAGWTLPPGNTVAPPAKDMLPERSTIRIWAGARSGPPSAPPAGSCRNTTRVAAGVAGAASGCAPISSRSSMVRPCYADSILPSAAAPLCRTRGMICRCALQPMPSQWGSFQPETPKFRHFASLARLMLSVYCPESVFQEAEPFPPVSRFRLSSSSAARDGPARGPPPRAGRVLHRQPAQKRPRRRRGRFYRLVAKAAPAHSPPGHP